MSLSSAEKAFVEKRERRVKYWPYFGAASLVLVAANGAWLYVKVPHLIDPWRVVESFEAGSLSESTMGVMAVMLPFVIATLLVFSFVVVLLWFVAFHNEHKLIRLVRKMETESVDGEIKESGQTSAALSNQE